MALKEIFRFIRPYIISKKRYVFLLFAISITVSILQAIPAEVTKRIFDIGFAEKRYNYILCLSFFLVILYLSKSLISYFLSKKLAIWGQDIIKQIRSEYFKYAINSDYGFYTEKDSVYINERLNEINNISSIFSSGVWDIIISSIQSLFVLLILLEINYILLLIMVLPIPIIYFFSNIYVSKIANSSNIFLEQTSINKSKMNEKITAIELIKLSGTEKEEMLNMKKIDEDMFGSQLKFTLLTRKFIEIVSVYVSLIPVVLYCVGGKFFVDGSITLGGIIVFSTYIGKIYAPFISFSTLSMNLATVKTSIMRLNNFFVKEYHKESFENTCLLKEKIENISFKNVYFKYNNTENFVIKDLNFDIRGKGVYQICGENGAGKSTIVKLLCRLLDYNDGKILYNNIPITQISQTFIRNIVTVMSQNVFLFDDTVENNILYGNQDVEEEKYLEVCKLLNIDDIFSSRGITKETMVGSRGIKLSGGEKQKIALARTILKNTDVIILDEAISNIDLETKKLIKQVICDKFDDKIVIIIDHSNYFSEIVKLTINI